CIPPPPPSEAFENADAVLMGRVTSFQREGKFSRVAKLTLLKLWKGERAIADEIFTGLNSASCGFDFVVGKTYVIYASKDEEGKLHTNICTRTRHIDQAGEDLNFLDQIDPIFNGGDSGCCGSVSGGDVIMAGGVLLFLLRRQRPRVR
ncbi:MAG: hypothetical protein ACE5IR_17720, partial [bacterium]